VCWNLPQSHQMRPPMAIRQVGEVQETKVAGRVRVVGAVAAAVGQGIVPWVAATG
jgi:hypothetical protein